MANAKVPERPRLCASPAELQEVIEFWLKLYEQELLQEYAEGMSVTQLAALQKECRDMCEFAVQRAQAVQNKVYKALNYGVGPAQEAVEGCVRILRIEQEQQRAKQFGGVIVMQSLTGPDDLERRCAALNVAEPAEEDRIVAADLAKAWLGYKANVSQAGTTLYALRTALGEGWDYDVVANCHVLSHRRHPASALVYRKPADVMNCLDDIRKHGHAEDTPSRRMPEEPWTNSDVKREIK